MNGNEIIKKAILNKEKISFGKIGGIESSHILNYMNSGFPSLIRGDSLSINAGINTNSQSELKKWLDSYIEAIKDLDYILEWCPEQGDKQIIEKIWNGKKIFDSFQDLEPFFHDKNGWQYSLHDKKILVVSPFYDTISQQAKKFDKLWNGVTPKEVKVIKSPYPSKVCGDLKNISYWINLQIMKRQIDMCDDYDFAIVGCGGFSLLVLQHIKSLGIPCVHLGGGTQLIFGIKGKRWDSDKSFLESNWYGTSEWTRPLVHEIPSFANLVENGCYW